MAAFLGLVFLFLSLSIFAQTVSPFNLPLYFEANASQTEFRASGGNCQFQISPSGVQMALRGADKAVATAQMEFIGANAGAQIHGDGELPGKINYLIGNDSSKWQTGLPTFSRVRVSEIYPGINLVFHGNQRQLEYDFDIAPGADPREMKIHFDGVDRISIGSQGDLVLKMGSGEIRQPRPEIYQTIAGTRNFIAGGYNIVDARTVAFKVSHYDHSRPLVIDPLLTYSAYFGNNYNSSTTGWAIAADTNGCIYIAGQTISTKFATVGAFQTNFMGGGMAGDAFVAKFTNNPPTNLVYLTYLGGSGDDAAYCVAADGSGHAYVAGATDSQNFPTNNPIPGHGQINGKPNTAGYFTDAFVTEVGTNGTNLVYSTYLGGESSEAAYGIAVDSAGNAYVTGFSYSTNFPCTSNALQTNLQCINSVYYEANAFVSEITNGGGNLIYSTYLGGTNFDIGRAIAVDSSNYVYVTGFTGSTNFPVWNAPTNSYPATIYLSGATNAFVTKFPPLTNQISSVTDLVYSFFLGGTNMDEANGIAADSNGCAYVTGWTASTNFPVSYPNMTGPVGLFSYLTTNGAFLYSVTNVFLTKIGATNNIIYSTVFGGYIQDIGYGVAVDSGGDAFVVGSESSPDFPALNTNGVLNGVNQGGSDVFVTAFNTNCSSTLYSVCIGGVGNDYGYGIALDSSTNAYITGQTMSPNYPTTNNVPIYLQNADYINSSNLIGGGDAFLTEIAPAPLSMAPQITSFPPSPTNTGVGQSISFPVTVTGTAPLTYQWEFAPLTNQFDVTNLVNNVQISGATNTTLTITNLQATNAGYYTFIVTNDWGSQTDTVQLTVEQWPVIIVPLTNQTVGIGSTVTFTVTAYGTPPLYYMWQTNGVLLGTNGGQFSGFTNNTLTITGVQTNNTGTYEVTVTNAYSTNALATPATNTATLTVLAAPEVTSLVPASGGLINGLTFTGVGGSNFGPFTLYGTTNLLLAPIPMTWSNIGTGTFGSQGQFQFTLTMTTNFPFFESNYSQEFFILMQTDASQ